MISIHEEEYQKLNKMGNDFFNKYGKPMPNCELIKFILGCYENKKVQITIIRKKKRLKVNYADEFVF